MSIAMSICKICIQVHTIKMNQAFRIRNIVLLLVLVVFLVCMYFAPCRHMVKKKLANQLIFLIDVILFILVMIDCQSIIMNLKLNVNKTTETLE